MGAVPLLVGVVLTACGGGQPGATSPSPSRPAAPVATEFTAQTWTTPEGQEWALDVLAPVDAVEGGWPVVVTFHGSAAGTSAVDLAEVAAGGVVVVGPRWIDPRWTLGDLDVVDGGEYVDGELLDVARCALGAAQQAAVEHGGDPSRTTVEGFSAGAHAAAWVGLGVVREDPCPDVDVIAPIAMVLGDSQLLFEGFEGEWDSVFADPGSRATDTVDRFLNPERWDVPAGFAAYLWSSGSGVVDRDVTDPPAPDSWLRMRGGEDLVTDLDELGAFDDGSVGFVDAGRLLELRLHEVGVAALHEELGGSHMRKPAAIERTIALAWGEASDA